MTVNGLIKRSQNIDIKPALFWAGNFYTMKNVCGMEEWMRSFWCRLEMQTELKGTVAFLMLRWHGDSTDLSPAINMDVAFFKFQCFITIMQSKIPELTFICIYL